ncbi:MAG: hypothetical protein NC485_12270 [Ruminococcus flavefaciens]|nr:hypothetical protein [Ruminococcus flavefaciens]MCM1060094.1 hypothetical protein [Eubacterium sp.]
MDKTSNKYCFYLCSYIEQKESDCRFNDYDYGFDNSQYSSQHDCRDNYWGLSEYERELLEMEGE